LVTSAGLESSPYVVGVPMINADCMITAEGQEKGGGGVRRGRTSVDGVNGEG